MATRSRIGIQLADQSVLSVYCHWDGYPKFNGVKLVEYHNSYDAAAKLIDGGDISVLHTNEGWDREVLPTTGPLYYADRGEFYEPRLDNNLGEYLANGEEFAYVYTQSEGWVCYDLHETPKIVAIPVPVAV